MKTLLIILVMIPFEGRSQAVTGKSFIPVTNEILCGNAFNQCPVINQYELMISQKGKPPYLKQPETKKRRIELCIPAQVSSAYKFKMCNLTFEPDLLLGVSYARQKLLSRYGCYILDDISGSLSANHLQVNIGYKF